VVKPPVIEPVVEQVMTGRLMAEDEFPVMAGGSHRAPRVKTGRRQRRLAERGSHRADRVSVRN
jgi:hypothetical protein